MKLQDAKTIAQTCVNTLLNVNENSFDDGRDNNNAEQNGRFCYTMSQLDEVTTKLAQIDIDGVEKKTLDDMWRKCAGEGYFNPNDPICVHNRNIDYANYILSLELPNEN